MGAVRTDILLDEEGNMQIANGDFVVGYADGQNGKLLLLSEPGNWRQYPLAGCAQRRLINAKAAPLQLLSYKKTVVQQFTNDGYTVNKITLGNTGVETIDYNVT